MRKFNIIRYLKRWWPLIALMSILAARVLLWHAYSGRSVTVEGQFEVGGDTCAVDAFDKLLRVFAVVVFHDTADAGI